jgi:hypothetical protein
MRSHFELLTSILPLLRATGIRDKMGSIQFSQNWSKMVLFERGVQKNEKTRRRATAI